MRTEQRLHGLAGALEDPESLIAREPLGAIERVILARSTSYRFTYRTRPGELGGVGPMEARCVVVIVGEAYCKSIVYVTHTVLWLALA